MQRDASGELEYWVKHPRLQLYQPPHWCEQSQQLIDWGTRELVPWVAQDPRPATIEKGKAVLEDQYWWLYGRVDDAHRMDERHADHPCLHRAWMELRIAVENTKFRVPIARFLAPSGPVAPPPRVIDADEPFEELPGVLDSLDDFQ